MDISIWDALVIAILQGTLEWLPVSSEGQVVLVSTRILEIDFSIALTLALFFHGATAAVILVRFRRDFQEMLIKQDYNLLQPVIIATVATGVIAVPLLFLIEAQWVILSEWIGSETASGEIITLLIGVSLVVTGTVLKSQTKSIEGERIFSGLGNKDAVILGVVQGLAVLPGISRSAMTVAFLLYVGLKQEEALRGSFLVGFFATMGASLLQILLGNIQLGKGGVLIESGSNGVVTVKIEILLIAIVVTFIAGWITMDILLRLSRELAFWKFCIAFGLVAVSLTIGPIIISCMLMQENALAFS